MAAKTDGAFKRPGHILVALAVNRYGKAFIIAFLRATRPQPVGPRAPNRHSAEQYTTQTKL